MTMRRSANERWREQADIEEVQNITWSMYYFEHHQGEHQLKEAAIAAEGAGGSGMRPPRHCQDAVGSRQQRQQQGQATVVEAEAAQGQTTINQKADGGSRGSGSGNGNGGNSGGNEAAMAAVMAAPTWGRK
jgi:hypothetical protein